MEIHVAQAEGIARVSVPSVRLESRCGAHGLERLQHLGLVHASSMGARCDLQISSANRRTVRAVDRGGTVALRVKIRLSLDQDHTEEPRQCLLRLEQ